MASMSSMRLQGLCALTIGCKAYRQRSKELARNLSSTTRFLPSAQDSLQVSSSNILDRVTFCLNDNGTVQGIESHALSLGLNPLHRESERKGSEAPQETANRGSHEGAKRSPAFLVQSVLEQHQPSAHVGVIVVDRAEDEDCKDATQSANDHLKAAPPVAAVRQANDEHRDGGGRDEIGNEVDLQNRGRFDGNDHDGNNDQNHGEADPPHVKSVAEQIVAGGRDHGGLKRVEGGSTESNGHDEDEADNPGGKVLKQTEEGDGTGQGVFRVRAGPDAGPGGDETGAAYHGDDNKDDTGCERDADP